MNETLRQRLEALRASWASTADIQEKRAEETRGKPEVSNGHYNYALALEACVEQLHQAMESASPEAEIASLPAVSSTAWLDALMRLADEMERKEEWWRNQKHDPHNIATGLMVAFAEIKTAIRTSASND